MKPQSIKDILENVLSQSGLDRGMEECKALSVWDDVASNLAARTEPTGISHGRMYVNVTDSVILHHLTFLKKKYIEKINLLLGKDVVKDIVFRVGKIDKKRQITESREDYITRLHNVKLDQDKVARIDEIVAQVEDEEIKQSLRELFISQAKLSKFRSMG